MNMLPEILHTQEEILVDARISPFVWLRGFYMLIIYALLCGGLVLFLQSETQKLTLDHFYQYYSFNDGFSKICNYIGHYYPYLRLYAEALRLLTMWPIVVVVIIAAVATVIRGILIKMKTELMVTNQRVMAKFGWLARDVVELHHHSVQDLTLSQTMLGRIFNFGSIYIRGYAGVIAVVDFVSNPFLFRMTALDEMERSLQGNLPPPETQP